ncbi:hypothetical protein MKW98_029310 [Papaver atlanticum]|uniref:Cytochrome b5 heme-binding domain-containing protein n=1 Tax=Papaver atlanticum TaxID=357466 RepID=A0AAD4SIV1_9MAGN|nr:hypothetical protein MKW98_029310 [Papaver atlanticum]
MMLLLISLFKSINDLEAKSYVLQANRELASLGKNLEKLKAVGSFLIKVFGALAVYDVTEFRDDHPGGDQVLLTAAGG